MHLGKGLVCFNKPNTSLLRFKIFNPSWYINRHISNTPTYLNKNNKHEHHIRALENDINNLDKTHIILKSSEFETNDSFKTNDLKFKKITKLVDTHSHSHSHSSNPLKHTHSHIGDRSQENFYKEMLSSKSTRKNPAIKITVIGLLK
ncbi:unnamed protein product [Hanseniaspora opuntiae]